MKFWPEKLPDDLFVAIPQKHTLKAWEPFGFCMEICFLLQNSDLDDEHPEWRIHWVAGVSMLRCIGHVLDKVDARTSEIHRLAISTCWNSWKQDRERNAIFWNFIENERNNLLKLYDFGVEPDDDGLFHNGLEQDGVQLFRRSMYWWRHQLMEIEFNLPPP